ncbi:MAG: serine/threonine-protein kinase, partial [Ktedonobacterales bacterium]
MGPGNTGNLVGRILGEYRLEALLGAGGMAEVYQGQDIALERAVAVKVLPASLAADHGYVERFREEAKRVALLSHPHIVPVYAYGEQDGLLYLVMPILRESLRDRMGRQPIFPPNDAARLVVQIASALDAAHAQGIVHRDVKPENILLDAEGKAHLTDFGIARDMDFLKQTGTNRTLAATGLPVGTPEYMAPEQLRAALVDQRADIYALGAVLYELLTGTVPHEAATPYEVAALVLTAPLIVPSARNPDLWPALDEVVMVALASDAEQRFPTMRRFAMALRRAVVEKDAGLAKLTMPARSFTGSPAVALAQAAALSGGGKRGAGAAVADWP